MLDSADRPNRRPPMSLNDAADLGLYYVERLFAFASDDFEVQQLRRIASDYKRVLDLLHGAKPKAPKRIRLRIHPRPVRRPS